MLNIGNFTGPLVYKPKDAPRYVPGFITVVVTSFAAGILMLVYRFVCVWENRKRDQSGTAEGYENAYQDDLTDKTVSTVSLCSKFFFFFFLITDVWSISRCLMVCWTNFVARIPNSGTFCRFQ